MRANDAVNHQTLVCDGIDQYLSSRSDISSGPQWTPPPVVQEINSDDHVTSIGVMRPLPFSPTMEGTSMYRDSVGSVSSRSDNSYDTETMCKSHSSHCNRRCFMSKAIHPLSLPPESHSRGIPFSGPAAFPEFGTMTLQRGTHHHHRSASSSVDFTEAQEPFELYPTSSLPSPGAGHFRCGLCDRYLSQRSPWSSRRIVKTGDMPTSGVLSCCHVFHVECLDQTTPKARKNDPPCPICSKLVEGKDNSPDQRVFSKVRNGFPQVKPTREDGPSKPWTCTQAGNCINSPPCHPLLSLSRSRFGKNPHLKSNNIGRDYTGKLRKSSPRLFIGSLPHGASGSTGGPGSK